VLCVGSAVSMYKLLVWGFVSWGCVCVPLRICEFVLMNSACDHMFEGLPVNVHRYKTNTIALTSIYPKHSIEE